MADSSGPAVVHCSAGVGRTGTLIALDIGIQALLQGESKLDILRIVSTLRQDRPGMVQTKDQYRFIHQVMKYFVTCSSHDCPPFFRPCMTLPEMPTQSSGSAKCMYVKNIVKFND